VITKLKQLLFNVCLWIKTITDNLSPWHIFVKKGGWLLFERVGKCGPRCISLIHTFYAT